MKCKVVVKPFAIKEEFPGAYEVVIGTTGFEARARYVFEKWRPHADLKWAPAFTNRKELSFQANDEFFKVNGYDTEEMDDRMFRVGLDERLRCAAKVAIDKDACAFWSMCQACRGFEWQASLRLQRRARTHIR